MNNSLETTEIVQLRSDAHSLLCKAEEVADITTLEHENRAVEFLVQVKRRFKIADGKRKDYVIPLKAVIDKLNADFSTILEPLEQAETIVKAGISLFRDTEDFKAKEVARLLAEYVATRAINDYRNETTQDTLETAQIAILAQHEASADAPKTVATQSGQARFRKDWKFEIIDEDEVPREMCTPDPVKIRAWIKNGTRDIQGIKIWEETTPIILI